LGIVGIELTREKMDIGDDVRDAFKNLFKTLTKSAGGPSEAPDLPSEIAHLQLRHRSAAIEGVMLPSASESAGTEAFLALLFPALEVIDAGGVLCIDELNSSLHPLLALEIVRLFADPNRNPRASQLIFNTHDVNLLDSSVLRRDEIWFTEKDQEGSGHLYSLSDFKPRINENFKRGYLQGRYGALPFLGSIDFGTQSS
jgi:hypothetical protein